MAKEKSKAGAFKLKAVAPGIAWRLRIDRFERNVKPNSFKVAKIALSC